MATGRINSRESIRTASNVVKAFGGSWQAVENAASVNAEGVHVLKRSDIDRARRNGTAERH